MNPRSDTDAKKAFLTVLLERGYDATITRKPADITASRGGVVSYFEIKFTNQRTAYFGAATLTEWEAALANEDRFWFVVASNRDGGWLFREYTPAEFMAFSYIPPFKVFFQVPLHSDTTGSTPGRVRKRQLSREAVTQMVTFYKALIAPS